jgi:hypothetical protein
MTSPLLSFLLSSNQVMRVSKEDIAVAILAKLSAEWALDCDGRARELLYSCGNVPIAALAGDYVNLSWPDCGHPSHADSLGELKAKVYKHREWCSLGAA